MSGKYAPSEHYLRDLPTSNKEIALSFEQIEGILNDRLPASAHEYQSWWANEKEGNHFNARARGQMRAGKWTQSILVRSG